MNTTLKQKSTRPTLVIVPAVRLKIEFSEELGYMNLLAYRLPSDKFMGSISIDSGDFSATTRQSDKANICRALSFALRNHYMLPEAYVRILRDHDNWWSVCELSNRYLQNGEKIH